MRMGIGVGKEWEWEGEGEDYCGFYYYRDKASGEKYRERWESKNEEKKEMAYRQQKE